MVAFELGGNDQDAINHVVGLSLAGVGLAACLGLGLDALRLRLLGDGGPRRPPSPATTTRRKTSQGAVRADDVDVGAVTATPLVSDEDGGSSTGGFELPPAWSVTLLLVSYGLLVPGLASVLLSFNIMIDFGLIKLGVGPHGGLDKVPAVTESMLGLVDLLRSTDCSLGAAAVILYAMVIPGVKLLLLLLAPLLSRRQPAHAALCVHIVQSISKWACPDMFAYILLMHLVRGLNHPMMLQARFRLDVGFTFFSIFCAVSTIAALGVEAKGTASRSGCWLRLVEYLGPIKTLRLAGFAALGLLVLLAVGLSAPVMSLRIRLDGMFKPHGPLPATVFGIQLQPVIDNLHIPEKANSDVSICEAIWKLQGWAMDGEANAALAVVMLVVFVLGLTLLDLLVLAAIARRIAARRAVGAALRKGAAAIRKVAMLDVLVAGVAVVTLCMSMYEKDGIFVSMRHGQLALLGAELLHYLIFFLVTDAAELHEQGLDIEYRGLSGCASSQDDFEECKFARVKDLGGGEFSPL